MPKVNDPIERSRTLGMTSPIRNEVIAALAEFCGTFMFLFMAFAATQAVLKLEEGREPTAASVLFVAAAFGGSLAAMVWAFYRISGGMFNPAVRVSLAHIHCPSPDVLASRPGVRMLMILGRPRSHPRRDHLTPPLRYRLRRPDNSRHRGRRPDQGPHPGAAPRRQRA